MKKVFFALITLVAFASVTAFAVPANYLKIAGGGIIVENEQLNPMNPAGIQFTNNFVQMEMYNGVAATGVTDPTGSANVMFVFPVIASLKFNELLGFRLGILESNETPVIPTAQGNVRMGTHPAAIEVYSPFSLTWAMKLANMGIGVRYELNYGAQGKWGDDNYNFSYSKHRIEPGILFNLGALSISVIGDLNFVFLNWAVATTNTTGVTFATNTVTAKSPLEMAMVRGQVSYPLSAKLLLAGRIEAGIGMFGYDEKYNANGGNTLTNDVQASAYTMKFMGGLKYSPIPIVDAYFDIGAKLFGHNKIVNEIGTGVGANATNTNVLNQVSLPSIALGVVFKPGIFNISIGLSQDIIASSTPISITPANLSTGYELDTSAPVYTLYAGNTVMTMIRNASAGISMNLNPVMIEAIFDISTTTFLADEIKNPLNVLSKIFGSAAGQLNLFTGLRCSVLF
jgi:hypothetical protein